MIAKMLYFFRKAAHLGLINLVLSMAPSNAWGVPSALFYRTLQIPFTRSTYRDIYSTTLMKSEGSDSARIDFHDVMEMDVVVFSEIGHAF